MFLIGTVLQISAKMHTIVARSSWRNMVWTIPAKNGCITVWKPADVVDREVNTRLTGCPVIYIATNAAPFKVSRDLIAIVEFEIFAVPVKRTFSLRHFQVFESTQLHGPNRAISYAVFSILPWTWTIRNELARDPHCRPLNPEGTRGEEGKSNVGLYSFSKLSHFRSPISG